jgi:hypothetical protein
MEWISVKDRLPDDFTEVLTTGDSGYRTYKRFFISARLDREWKGEDWLDATGERLSDLGWHPTHWCDLPNVGGIE